MRHPLISTLLSLLIWLVFIAFFVTANLRDEEKEYSLEVDASIVDDTARQNKTKTVAIKETGENQAQTESAIGSKTAQITDRTLPQIPDELRDEAFKSFAVARFHINKNGNVKVELIQPCSSPQLNRLLLNSLQKWQFAPATKNGAPIDSVRDIRVDFKVE